MKFALYTIPIVVMLAACGESLSVEQKIIATLQTMEERAEAGEHFQFMGHVSDSFSAEQGSMSRHDFRRFMIVQMAQHRRLNATFFPIYVRESGEDTASAHFRLLLTGGGGLLPEKGQLFEVETKWLLVDGDWMLDDANWEIAQLPEIPTATNPDW